MTSMRHHPRPSGSNAFLVGESTGWIAACLVIAAYLVWIGFSQQQQAADTARLQAEIAARAGLATRMDRLEAAVSEVQGGLANLTEKADTLGKDLDARLTALEQRPAQEAPAPQLDHTAFIAALAADVQALAVMVRTLMQETDALADMEGRLARLEQLPAPVPPAAEIEDTAADVSAARPAAAPAPSAAGATDAQVAALRDAAMQAFQTLDGQLQAITGRLDRLAARDEELDLGQEATMVALQTQLNDWRKRHSPPVWDMAAQLSGVTIRFSEATRYTDPNAADTALQRVAGLLLASDPSLGLRVVGYADFDGTDSDSNRVTSQKRADAVRQQLVSLGVPEARLLAVGRSTEDRVIDSDAAGNANRRVIFEPFLLKDVQ